MLKSTVLSLFVAVLGLGMHATHAEEKQGMENMNMPQEIANAGAQIHLGHGTVNKINAEAGKVNITHDPIATLKWPRMTMDFTVQNKADLAEIKPGMKVKFEITMKGKGYHLTRIVPD